MSNLLKRTFLNESRKINTLILGILRICAYGVINLNNNLQSRMNQRVINYLSNLSHTNFYMIYYLLKVKRYLLNIIVQYLVQLQL